MKKLLILVVTCFLFATVGCSKGDTYVAGTYSAEADGYAGKVKVTITTDAKSITDVKVEGAKETEEIGGAALSVLAERIMKAQSAEIDVVTGATYTSNGAKEAALAAIEMAKKGEGANDAELTYTPGTYTGTGVGYNGEVKLDVTFDEKNIVSIEVNSQKETAYVGSPAYDILFADAIEANGSGVDVVSGATFTSRAIKEALNDAATQAGATNMTKFKSNTVVHEAQADIEETYDVVVVGAGGAGMGAAAEAAMNGLSVLVLEQNAEVGGNTLVSGGQFQAVMDYLVWDANDPEATEAVWEYNGQTYNKVKAVHGQLDTLKTILNWNEEAFDEHYFDDKEYVPGEIDLVSKAGVHAEYLPTLKALKDEIRAYVDYADKKMAAGASETDLTLFSTVNLHIFQTYYGGLRQNSDKTEWIYGDFELVKQFCEEGYDLKVWLEDQGALFNDGAQITLIGALWYRENINLGCDIDGDGNKEAAGNWGTYFLPTMNTILNTSSTAASNKIMTRTTAEKLIVEDGRVTGVEAVMYDGTKVIAHANKGVVLTTGGYAANISMVADENIYWKDSYITNNTQTTNRSSLTGSGIDMATEAGAATTGLGFTQMMPISWVDNGDLAFGNGLYGIYVNPTTGVRFVDESAERDVLSLGEFANGIEYNGSQGVFLEFTNAATAITFPYPYDKYEGTTPVEISTEDVEGRVYYFSSQDELQTILDKFGMTASPADIYATIENYDKSILANEQPSDGVAKLQSTVTVGTVAEDGTYKLDGELLRVRIMAPSTHHTMGGVVVDTQRHVLDDNGTVIPGLYAAGEVTGGIHGGNRLGGNAIVEIFVSGINAANAIVEDNK
ncbi:MAG: FAD-dependent oxidoreductase [Erysipelotrichaceae bacterium]